MMFYNYLMTESQANISSKRRIASEEQLLRTKAKRINQDFKLTKQQSGEHTGEIGQAPDFFFDGCLKDTTASVRCCHPIITAHLSIAFR